MKSCEKHCVHNKSTPIPKHVHFVSLNRPFSFLEWLAVVSVRRKLKPDKITVYTNGQQDSCWWRRILPYVEHQIILSMPGTSSLNGVPIKLLSHMSDFLRVLILYHHGGIYMDTDILSFKSFEPLLRHQVVASEQCPGEGRVNGALLMAQRHSCVICEFAHVSCKKFDGRWVSHAVNALSAFMHDLDKEREGVLIMPWKKGFHPLCWHKRAVDQLYNQDIKELTDYNITDIYSVHLYHKNAEQMIQSTVYNYEWIQTSLSLVAHAIRDSLPPNFSRSHLDESACTGIQLPEI